MATQILSILFIKLLLLLFIFFHSSHSIITIIIVYWLISIVFSKENYYQKLIQLNYP